MKTGPTKNKSLKRTAVLFISLLLLLTVIPCAIAQPETEPPGETEAEERVVILRTPEEFFSFAENCRLDRYSQGLTVELEEDIDLTDTGFAGVPIFCGIFNGNGHTVSGLNITARGSVMGLFRYVTETATVSGLSVQGTVAPEGSRGTVGGIAGSNAGQLIDCSFSGTVSGGDHVGGICGENILTGILQGCTVEGTVTGNHFVGGITGESAGVIRNCENAAEVNTTPQQNNVEISDITLETLAGTEAVNTTTNVGGIAGVSTGVIRICTNRGDVGYRQIGYNIGGIAGSQSGYIADCENYGAVSGRKEVGGIVGQLEPVIILDYSEDTLQILEGQMDTMAQLTDRAANNAQNSASNITGQMAVLQDQVSDAGQALEMLTPTPDPNDPLGPPALPDEDTLLAAQNTLSSSLSQMQGTMGNISAATQNVAGTVGRDMRAIGNQMEAMQETLEGASENLGGSVRDASDLDTEEDRSAKVERSTNYGTVLADLNVGGIAGAIALENDLAQRDNLAEEGESSLNISGEVRGVILNCENDAAVTVKKQNGGGIVGWMQFGLVKSCLNTGALEGERADYIGGITGNGTGFIRNSSGNCPVTGNAFVGGIAGSASVVTNCYALTQITGTERVGAILGLIQESPYEAAEEESAEGEEDGREMPPIAENGYLPVGTDPGAIDGVSYDGLAQPLPREELLAREDLPEIFRTITVRFLVDDEVVHSVTLPLGERLKDSDIPKLPEREGFSVQWDGLHRDVIFDCVFRAVYTPLCTALESEASRGDGRPILLAQGSFAPETRLILNPCQEQPQLQSGEELLETTGFAVMSETGEVTLRYLPPEGERTEELHILVFGSDGEWRTRTHTLSGSYLVFDVEEGEYAFALVAKTQIPWRLILCAGGAVVLILTVSLIRKKRKKETPDRTQEA